MHRSRWRPFRDGNGVSGHAFMGAIPLLAAAELTENRWVKVGRVAASVLPGFSRLTDAEHDPSQVLIGWSPAYPAASAVSESITMNADGRQLVPLPIEHGQGAARKSAGDPIASTWNAGRELMITFCFGRPAPSARRQSVTLTRHKSFFPARTIMPSTTATDSALSLIIVFSSPIWIKTPPP